MPLLPGPPCRKSEPDPCGCRRGRPCGPAQQYRHAAGPIHRAGHRPRRLLAGTLIGNRPRVVVRAEDDDRAGACWPGDQVAALDALVAQRLLFGGPPQVIQRGEDQVAGSSVARRPGIRGPNAICASRSSGTLAVEVGSPHLRGRAADSAAAAGAIAVRAGEHVRAGAAGRTLQNRLCYHRQRRRLVQPLSWRWSRRFRSSSGRRRDGCGSHRKRAHRRRSRRAAR